MQTNPDNADYSVENECEPTKIDGFTEESAKQNGNDFFDTAFELTRWDQELFCGELYHPELSEYMGNVSEIYQDTGDIMFRVGTDIYGFTYEELGRRYTLTEADSNAYVVNSSDFTQLVFEETEDGTVNCFRENGDCYFKGLDLGEKEKIIDCSFSLIYVISGETGNYTVKAYIIQDDRTLTLEHEYPVVGYNLGADRDMEESIKSEYWFRSDVNAWELYVVTERGNLYMFNDVELGFESYKFCVGQKYTVATDVDKIYESVISGVGHYAPVYSRLNDTTALYTLVPGESIWEQEDDAVVKIILPNGYSTKNVRNIIGCQSAVVIEFADGSIYSANSIGSNHGGEYSCEIISGLSELNKERRIVSMAAPWTVENRLYILLNDGVVYFIVF
ncbi:MAG: hypothetical protein ACI3V2_09700 [Faecousia sp.]